MHFQHEVWFQLSFRHEMLLPMLLQAGVHSSEAVQRGRLVHGATGASHSHQRRQPACLLSGNARSLCRQPLLGYGISWVELQSGT